VGSVGRIDPVPKFLSTTDQLGPKVPLGSNELEQYGNALRPPGVSILVQGSGAQPWADDPNFFRASATSMPAHWGVFPQARAVSAVIIPSDTAITFTEPLREGSIP
jgi:hypothetical protein